MKGVKGTGWSYSRRGLSFCRSCNEHTGGKPSAKCENREHFEAYLKQMGSRRHWARCSLNNHKLRGFEVRISIDELDDLAMQTNQCCICGSPLDWSLLSKKHPILDSPSLDRRDNGNILAGDNVWIICRRCNISKNTQFAGRNVCVV